jgi:hypothetical protein
VQTKNYNYDEMNDEDLAILSAINEEKKMLEENMDDNYSKSLSHIYKEETDDNPSKKMLKRDLKRMALLRLEDAARSEDDFREIIDIWNKNDSNRERKERYHEVGRSVVPLEYGARNDGLTFPLPVNRVLFGQMLKGDFIDTIFYCPYELHELVEDEKISKCIRKMKIEHKELLFNLFARNLSPVQMAAVKNCTDRNIRKIRNKVLDKIRLETGYE